MSAWLYDPIRKGWVCICGNTIPSNVIDYAFEEVNVNSERVASKFQELWAAVHDQDTPPPPAVPSERLGAKAAASINQNQQAAQMQAKRAYDGDYAKPNRTSTGGPSSSTSAPTPSQSVWEALDRSTKATDALYITLNELEEKLQGVVAPTTEEVPNQTPSQPSGFGVALCVNSTAQSIEGAVYRVRSILSRLSL